MSLATVEVGHLLLDIANSMDTSLSKLREMVKDREAWRASVDVESQTRQQLNNYERDQA